MMEGYYDEKQKAIREGEDVAKEYIDKFTKELDPAIKMMKAELGEHVKDMKPEELAAYESIFKAIDLCKSIIVDEYSKYEWSRYEIDKAYQEIGSLKKENECLIQEVKVSHANERKIISMLEDIMNDSSKN